jgi:hypothetical protein
VKEENYLSISPALNVFLVEKAPKIKTEIKEWLIILKHCVMNLKEDFRNWNFSETLYFVSSPLQEVCKEYLRKMEERLSTFACDKHKLE